MSQFPLQQQCFGSNAKPGKRLATTRLMAPGAVGAGRAATALQGPANWHYACMPQL